MDSNTSLPTGRWIGFHDCPVHGRIWHRFNLTFTGARISGGTYRGQDLLPIRGAFEAADGRCSFTLECAAIDLDTFDGLWDGARIAGAFRCHRFGCAGSFQIWPFRDGGGARLEEFAEETLEPWVEMIREMVSPGQDAVRVRRRQATPPGFP